MNLQKILDEVLGTRYFKPFGEEPPAIDAILEIGTTPVVIITGPNASGKSVVRRLVTERTSDLKIECIRISQEGRSSSGIIKAMMYGSEEFESTGEISAHTLLKSMQTAKSREKHNIVFLDEPEIGLSDEYAASAGQHIARFANEIPQMTLGVFVVTHRKVLVKSLLKELNGTPYHFRLGNPIHLNTWVDSEVIPLPLESLNEVSHERFKKIQSAQQRKPNGTNPSK